MTYLRTVSLATGDDRSEYPFSVPAIRSLSEIGLANTVTFFAGGNGTGKSTLLEAIAVKTDRVMIGDGGVTAATRELAAALTVSWGRRTKQGFFLRAEDFLSYKRGVVREIADLRQTADRFGDQLEGYGLQLAQGAVLGQARALTSRYGEDLDAMSHGESFLHFFRARFTGPGLYMLDEPDTALSAQSVLGLVAALNSMTTDGQTQFIIATHNPILLALPGATLISFDRDPAAEVAWEDLEQVALIRDFLTHPSVYMRHLVD